MLPRLCHRILKVYHHSNLEFLSSQSSIIIFLIMDNHYVPGISLPPSMANERGPEKLSTTVTTDITQSTHKGQKEQTLPVNLSKMESRTTCALKFWSLVLVYTICCIALSLIMVLLINGFNAAESSTPRYVDNKLQLRVADITTHISAGLVVIRLLGTS